MSARDFLHFLFETSQVDASTEALLRETEETERLTAKKTPLLKALKSLGIPVENVTVDEDGAKLTVPDAALWHEIVRKLGSVEAVNNLADEGWVPEFAGDVADTTELPEYVLNFLPLHDVEYSEQDKATPVDALNKEVQGGSDTVIPPEQKKRDEERRHGVKVGESSVDALLAADVPDAQMEAYLHVNDPRQGLKGQLSNFTDGEVKAAYKKEDKAARRAAIKAEAKRRGISLGEGASLSEVDSLLEAPESGPQGDLAPWAPGTSFDHLPDAYPKRASGYSRAPSWSVEPDGNLKITINNPEDLAELKEKVAAGDTSENLFISAIEHPLGNGLNWVEPHLIGALTDSPILSDVPINDEDDATDSDGAKIWWYPDYQVRSPVEDLAEKGFVIFKSALSEPAKESAQDALAKPGAIQSPVVGESKTPTKKAIERARRDGAESFRTGGPSVAHSAKKEGAAKKDESLDALLEAPEETFLGTDQPETCRKCGRRVDVLSGGEVEGQPMRVRCTPCNIEYSVEDDPELGYENPLDAQGRPIEVEYVAGTDTGRLSWEDFCEANSDMDFAELSDIRNTILRGEAYKGGGGAAGEYTVTRVPVEAVAAEADAAAQRQLDPSPRNGERFNTP